MGAIRIAWVYIYYMSMSIVRCAVLVLLAKVFKQEVQKDENEKTVRRVLLEATQKIGEKVAIRNTSYWPPYYMGGAYQPNLLFGFSNLETEE